jgi:hypothetical protein
MSRDFPARGCPQGAVDVGAPLGEIVGAHDKRLPGPAPLAPATAYWPGVSFLASTLMAGWPSATYIVAWSLM